ncbi:hypothetical protein [Jannaschia seohaensis]|nr:hypothetical protein [Jannaschia seohaensis]
MTVSATKIRKADLLPKLPSQEEFDLHNRKAAPQRRGAVAKLLNWMPRFMRALSPLGQKA